MSEDKEIVKPLSLNPEIETLEIKPESSQISNQLDHSDENSVDQID